MTLEELMRLNAQAQIGEAGGNRAMQNAQPTQPNHGTLRSYNPGLRERIGNWVFDKSQDMGAYRSTADKLRNAVTFGADFVPGVGESLDANQAGRDFAQGNYGSGSMHAGAAVLGVMPVVGDAAAKGLKKFAAGAPDTVKNSQMAAAIRKRYRALMDQGADYRHWYDKAGAGNLEHMGGDPTAAAKFTGAQAVTSANTPVDANLGHAIRAHNQKMAGQPAKAGQFPNAMGPRIDKVYEAHSPGEVFDTLGNKVGPYAENIAKGGGYAQTNQGRAVHDIWDARNWGYSEKEMAGGMSPSQHKYMDDQMSRTIADAKRLKTGGVDDWDERSGQAASWIAQKARTEGSTVADAGKSYPDYFSKYYAQGSYESAPGKTTNHMQGLLDAPLSKRQQHMEEVAKIMTDDHSRDKVSLAFGAPTGKSFSGPGLFEGDINPGMQSQVALGRATGGQGVDQSSAALMDAIESTHGLLLGQDAAAWHLAGNPKEALKRTNLLDMNLGGTVDDDMFRSLMKETQGQFGPNAFDEGLGLIPTEQGVRLIDFAGGGTDFAKGGKKIAAKLGIDDVQTYKTIGGNLIENDWSKNMLGQSYLAAIDRPEFEKAFDSVAPTLAKRLYELDATIGKAFGDTGRSQVQRLRQIVADGGIKGLRDAIAKGALSVGAVGIMMNVMSRPGDNSQT